MGRQKGDPTPNPKAAKTAKPEAHAGKAGGDERRRHRRVPARFPFRIVSDGKEETFELVDLSESGVRIRCLHAIAPMTRIRVSMTLPAKRVGAGTDVRFETLGVVVWSHRSLEAIYDTGVFFSDLDERQRSVLRAYVVSHGDTEAESENEPQPA